MDGMFSKPPFVHRRSYSAPAIPLNKEKGSYSQCVADKARTPSRVVNQGDEDHTFPELDFADKLRALRQLISSSKARRESKQALDNRGPIRVIARRLSPPSFSGTQKVDKIRFTASSFERREPAEKDGESIISTASFLYGRPDSDYDPATKLEEEIHRMHRVFPPAESYRHSSNVDHPNLRTFSSGEFQDTIPSVHSPFVEVSFSGDFANTRGLKRHAASSLGFCYPYHDVLEVPERDWDSSNILPGKAASHHRDQFMGSTAAGEDLQSTPLHNKRQGYDICDSYKSSAANLAAEYNRINNNKPIHISVSAQMDHVSSHQDSTSTDLEKSKQTNLQIQDKSYLITKAKQQNTKNSKVEHWTQVLSQKRRVDRTSLSAPCSPAPKQTNVPLDFSYPSLVSLHIQQNPLRKEDHTNDVRQEYHASDVRQKDRANDVRQEYYPGDVRQEDLANDVRQEDLANDIRQEDHASDVRQKDHAKDRQEYYHGDVKREDHATDVRREDHASDISVKLELHMPFQEFGRDPCSSSRRSARRGQTCERVEQATEDPSDETKQDAEVAEITQQSRVRKIISRKRGSVRVPVECSREKLPQTACVIQQTSAVQEQHRQWSAEIQGADINLQTYQPAMHWDHSAGDLNLVHLDRHRITPQIPKDDHIITLEKLKTLLRSRRSELRSDSRGSSASSPSPLKAFHSNFCHCDGGPTQAHLPGTGEQISGFTDYELVSRQDGKETDAYDVHKTVHRKLIRRPPSGGRADHIKNDVKKQNVCIKDDVKKLNVSHKEASVFENPLTCYPLLQDPSIDRSDSGTRSHSHILQRPSSAPQSQSAQRPKLKRPSTPDQTNKDEPYLRRHSSKLASSRTIKSDRELNFLQNSQGQNTTEWKPSLADHADKEMTGSFASASILRSNVQRLYHEVSSRMEQEEYILQDLMSKADDSDKYSKSSSSKTIKNNLRKICRQLSFDEVVAGTDEEKNCSEDKMSGEVCGTITKEWTSETTNVKISPCARDPGPNLETVAKRLVTRLTHTVRSEDESLFVANRFARSDKTGKSTAGVEHSFYSPSLCDNADRSRKNFRHLLQTDRPEDNDDLDDHFASYLGNGMQLDEPADLSEDPLAPSTSGVQKLVGFAVSSENSCLHREHLTPQHHRRFSSARNNLKISASGTMPGFDSKQVILSQLGNINMVSLLQRLYSADDQTRRTIILQAHYFKHWQSTAHMQKQQRQIYEESLHRAQFYIVHKLHHRYFRRWRTAAEEQRGTKAADAIHRRHMLQKGLQAFRWAILRSKHQSNVLKQRVQGITSRASFTKWQILAKSRREHRMRGALVRWQEFTREEKNVYYIQRNLNEKLLYQAMTMWRCVYDRQVKENIAANHIRLTRLKHAWQMWRVFTQISKDKTRCLQLAMSLQSQNMQRRSLHFMVRAWHQSKKARQYFCTKWLAFILHRWHQGAQISRAERQRDMAISVEHRRQTVLRHVFYNWLHKLYLHKAWEFAKRTLYRSKFHRWLIEWQHSMQHQQAISAAVMTSRLRRCLLTWRRNVVDWHRKQRQAVQILEQFLLHNTLLSWQQYTSFKMAFRITLQQHRNKLQRETVNRCFSAWKSLLLQRLDEKHKHEMWSLSCARKMAARWQHTCHLHHLQLLLQDTEPHRQLGLMRCAFVKWLAAKRKADRESTEALASQCVLQLCAMQRRFQEWRLATHRHLVIKPIILHRERLLMTRHFDAWVEYVKRQHQRQCSRKEFQRNQLARAVARWRRQQQCQQLARWSQQRYNQRLVLCLLWEWHAIIHRKRLACHFHNNSLLLSLFKMWISCTKKNQQQRAVQLAELVLSRRRKRYYFEQWLSGLNQQMAATSAVLLHLQQQQARNHIKMAFVRWRRSVHVHQISRAYQKSACQCLLRTLILEWHRLTSQSLCKAVQHFAQQVGLHSAGGTADIMSFSGNRGVEMHNTGYGNDLQRCGQMGASHADSSAGVPLESACLPDTLDKYGCRNERMQEIAMIFVVRLAHWPASLAFSCWWDYTQHQHQLRLLAEQAYTVHYTAVMSQVIRLWRSHLMAVRRASKFRNWQLLHKSVQRLKKYSELQTAKTVLKEKSRAHSLNHVLSKVFPYWRLKAREKQYQRSVVHLWTSATPQETQLLPLEMTLNRQLRQRRIKLYFSVWKLNFLFLSKLKNTYHKQLLGRVLLAWQEWASIHQGQDRNKQKFLHARIMSLAFKTWCLRAHQKQETEWRYHRARQSHLQAVFLGWQTWARESKRLMTAQKILKQSLDKDRIVSSFRVWWQLTKRFQTVRTGQKARLILRVFGCWQQVVAERRQSRQVILAFQLTCVTHLVKRVFGQWQDRYQGRVRAYKYREEVAKQCALCCGRKWHRRAQDTRGRKLTITLKYNRLMGYFSRWKSALSRVQALQLQQKNYTKEKNKILIPRFMKKWQQHHTSVIVSRAFSCRLQVSVLQAWHTYTEVARDRHIRGVALQRAVQEQSLHRYFLYWWSLTERAHFLKNGMELKLQMKVFRAWRFTARRRSSQRLQGEKFACYHQHRQKKATFMTLRSRFHYCQALRETANGMCDARNVFIVRKALREWKSQLDVLLASRFYKQLLCRRVTKKWRQFVLQVKTERHHETAQECKAVLHHNKHICGLVLKALKDEVRVCQHLQLRRQRCTVKCAFKWKHLTDMAVAACLMEKDILIVTYWQTWRLAWRRREAVAKTEATEKRHILSQVFTVWYNLCPSRGCRVMQRPGGGHEVSTAVPGRVSTQITRSLLPVPVGSRQQSVSESSRTS